MKNDRTQRAKKGAARAPQTVVNAIASILSHCWSEEFADYQARERHERANHVFRELLKVRRWLEKCDCVQVKQGD